MQPQTGNWCFSKHIFPAGVVETLTKPRLMKSDNLQKTIVVRNYRYQERLDNYGKKVLLLSALFQLVVI